ncbi:hypothetical protein GMDG_05792 [Pseudogymnoascus destructans 20631-21]|uniref:Uncharacterized protein n=1 Tax=Pseudogymnoascus destructans (strain ATCC MYA-4855 / 20631-21) TaxID=658429 RepID=L8FPF0_PSED2|nr:hypothetical protein GMDG_05792 [Pseudogymnoascus destructans 20631-21]
MSAPPPPQPPPTSPTRTGCKRPRSPSPSPASPASTSTLPTFDFPTFELSASTAGLPTQGLLAQAPTRGFASFAPSAPSQHESGEERRQVRSGAPTPSPNLGAAHGYSAATDAAAPTGDGGDPTAGGTADGAPPPSPTSGAAHGFSAAGVGAPPGEGESLTADSPVNSAPPPSGPAPFLAAEFSAHSIPLPDVPQSEPRTLQVPQNHYFEAIPAVGSGRSGGARMMIPHSPDPGPQSADPSSSAPLRTHSDREVGAGPAPDTAVPTCGGPSSSAPQRTHKARGFGAGPALGTAVPTCAGYSSSAPVHTHRAREFGAGTAPGSAVPTSRGQAPGAQSFVGRLGSLMRGTREAIIVGRQHRREERERVLTEVVRERVLREVRERVLREVREGAAGNRGDGNGDGVGNGVGGYLHEGAGDVNMDGDNAMAGNVAMDGDVTMDEAEDDTEHAEPQNGYEDSNEAAATAPVGPPSMRTTSIPYIPYRSTPLPNHLQTVPPNGPSPAARGYSGSIQLPRPEAVSRERERRYGSSAGETRPCGCFCTDPWAEEGWRWVYCGKHQRIRQEEEDEEVEGGTTLPRDWDGDGKEPEPPRGRSRFRD